MLFFIFWPLPEKLLDCPKKNYFAGLWGLQPPAAPSPQLIRMVPISFARCPSASIAQ